MFQRVRLINESDAAVVSVAVRPSPAIPALPGTWAGWPANFEFDLLPSMNDQLAAPTGGPNVPPFPFLPHPVAGCANLPAMVGAAVLVTYADLSTRMNYVLIPTPSGGMEELGIRIVGSVPSRQVRLEATYGGVGDCIATYVVFNPFPRD